MKTIVEYLNEAKQISEKEFNDAVAEYNQIMRYYKANSDKKVSSADSKKMSNMKSRINMYLDQNDIKRMDWWRTNEFAG